MTNYDAIHAMDPTDLAMFLNNYRQYVAREYPCSRCHSREGYGKRCLSCMQDWLEADHEKSMSEEQVW